MRVIADPEALRIRKAKRQKFESEVMNRAWEKVYYDAKDFLEANDFEFFLGSTTVSQAARNLKEFCKLTWTLKELRVVVSHCAKYKCRFWHKRIKPERMATVADSDYWDQLKITAEKLSVYLSMEGVTENTALRIFRTKISTNKYLMRGLPARLQYWNH